MPAPPHLHGRIALVVDTSTFGGAEVYVGHLLRRLPPELPRALLIRAPAPTQLTESAEAAGVQVVPWRATPTGLLALRRVLQTASIVHLNLTAPGHNRHAIIAAWLCRRPVIGSLHLYLEPRSALRRHLLRFCYRRFRRVIAVSADIQHALISRLGVRPDRVRLVPNGVEVAEPSHLARTPCSERSATMRIGAIGRLTRQKGLDLLIEAAQCLVMAGHGIDVVIAGAGPERATLEESARGLPIRFLGTVSDTAAFLNDIDVFCLPSRWEGMPFALLEAMMAGKACVASAVGDVPVALGPAGVVVASDDVNALVAALEKLLVSPHDRDALGRAAHRRARDRYTIDRMVQRTAAVYADLQNAQPAT